MARNRKRAKERRARQRQPVATARGERAQRVEHDDTIDPIRHAAPDAELAEAQLALGRPEFADPGQAESEPVPAEELSDDAEPELSETDFQSEEDLADAAGAGGLEVESGYDEVEPADAGGGRGRPGRRGGSDHGGSDGGSAVLPAPHVTHGNRLVNFLQGSWRELQRVQWPDRRQVIQATGVVLGFVIVAGVYLGVADTVASHLMDWILK